MFVRQTNHREQYTKEKTLQAGMVTSSSGQGQIIFPRLSGSVSASTSSQSSYSNSSPRQKAITDALVDMIADCMLPLQLVERKAFQNFMAVVEQPYNVPSRRTVTRHLHDGLQVSKDKLKSELDSLADDGIRIGTVHTTVDLWSTRTMESVIGVRFHYFNKHFQLRVKTAAYRQLSGRHTGANIVEAFEDIIHEYGVRSSELGYQVTDSASNMIKAFQLFETRSITTNEVVDSDSETESPQTDFDPDGEVQDDAMTSFNSVVWSRRLPCCCHTLQLVVRDALKRDVDGAGKILQEASAVVSFFHRSLIWSEELKKLSGGLCLLSAVPTRWNSSFIMMRRLSKPEVWKAVMDTLQQARNAKAAKVPRLTASRASMVDLITLLEPFNEATDALQSDGVTLSMVIPAVLGIDEALKKCETQLHCLRNALQHGLAERFQDLIMKPHYVIATVLDCRYKLIPFNNDHMEMEVEDEASGLQAITRSQARAHLLNMLTTTASQSSVVANTIPNEQPAVQDEDNAKSSIFSKFSQPLMVLDDSEDNKYCMSPTEHQMKPEAYWAANGSRYPRLAELARIFLSVPASSGSVERLFSVSGAILRARRSRLTAQTVESLLLHMDKDN